MPTHFLPPYERPAIPYKCPCGSDTLESVVSDGAWLQCKCTCGRLFRFDGSDGTIVILDRPPWIDRAAREIAHYTHEAEGVEAIGANRAAAIIARHFALASDVIHEARKAVESMNAAYADKSNMCDELKFAAFCGTGGIEAALWAYDAEAPAGQ